MKDYRAIEGLQDNVRVEVKVAYDKGYKQGYEDGKKDQEEKDIEKVEQILKNDNNDKKACKEQAYQNGLDEAWEAARKIVVSEEFPLDTLDGLFGMDMASILENFSASEAIVKIREYEEKQKQAGKNCDSCQYKDKLDAKCLFCEKEQNAKIKIGDEVEADPTKLGDKFKYVVFEIDKNHNLAGFTKNGEYKRWNEFYCRKTGRHFPEIEKVLEAMREGEE